MKVTPPPQMISGPYSGAAPVQSKSRLIPVLIGSIRLAAVLVYATVVAGIYFYRSRTRAAPINITAEDMTATAEAQPSKVRAKLANDASARKEFAKNVRELLAVAEEARAAGLAERADVKRQMELSRSVFITQKYFESKGEATDGSTITDAEVDALYKERGVESRYQEFEGDIRKNNPNATDEQLKQVKKQFGRVTIGERRGIAAGIDKRRDVKVQVILQQARVLASTYANETLTPKSKASEAEIDDYIAKHPEFNSSALRSRAEDILKRARAGEDFGTLAKQNSTEPGSKDNEGDLGWFRRGTMVAEFENVAFALKVGQISDVVETQFGFHIIKLEGRRNVELDGKSAEEIRARHILIGPASSDGTSPPTTLRQQARATVEKEKEQKLLDEIVARSHVIVAENFTVSPPSPK